MVIHKGDFGTVIEFTLTDVNGDAVNISDMTTKEMLLKKPAGSLLTKTAVFVTDGTDGKLQYTTLTGDVNEAGEWQLQIHVAKTDANFYSDIKTVTVEDILT